MKNLILKQGDMVKALHDTSTLAKNRLYTVQAVFDQGKAIGLGLQTGKDTVLLVDEAGQCLDACENVTVHRFDTTMTLPQGTGKTWN